MLRPALALLRAAFALLALAAITVQLLDLAAKGTLDPINYFSYFTIQANLIGAAALLWAASRWRGERSAALDWFRGAAVVYLTVTLIVFAVLLSGTDVDTAIPWVDTVLHRVMPIVLIVDWLIDPPLVRLTARRALAWLIYPLAWTAYTLVRGAIVGWYPYPFLDPANGGYGRVALYVVAILVGGTLPCLLVAGVGNALRRRLSG